MTAAISSINATGHNTATASGSAIVSLSHTNQVTQKGVYRITAIVGMGSGPASTDQNNAVVNVGSTSITVPTTPVAGAQASVTFYATLDGSTDVAMVVGTNIATATYSGTLVAEYGGPAGGLFTGR